MSEQPDLNNDQKTVLTLETPDERITVGLQGANLSVTEFMELVELLVVNAKYEKRDLEDYIVKWAEDIKATKEN